MTGILQLAKDAADELSLTRPGSLSTTTTDATAQKLFRHLTRTCRQLSARYDWQRLRKEKTFVTVAAATQTNATATDFLRFVEMTIFNRTKRRHVKGPMTSLEWQSYQASTITPVLETFYMRGNAFLITPTPAAGETIAYEYITKNIGMDSLSVTEKDSFTDDADITFFDDELVVLGTVWRYRKSEGLDYSEEFREFELRFADLVKMDGGRRRLDMNDNTMDRTPNVQGSEIDFFVST